MADWFFLTLVTMVHGDLVGRNVCDSYMYSWIPQAVYVRRLVSLGNHWGALGSVCGVFIWSVVVVVVVFPTGKAVP